MERSVRTVPYGYEEATNKAAGKGTMAYYDTFEDVTDGELERAVAIVREARAVSSA